MSTAKLTASLLVLVALVKRRVTQNLVRFASRSIPDFASSAKAPRSPDISCVKWRGLAEA